MWSTGSNLICVFYLVSADVRILV